MAELILEKVKSSPHAVYSESKKKSGNTEITIKSWKKILPDGICLFKIIGETRDVKTGKEISSNVLVGAKDGSQYEIIRDNIAIKLEYEQNDVVGQRDHENFIRTVTSVNFKGQNCFKVTTKSVNMENNNDKYIFLDEMIVEKKTFLLWSWTGYTKAGKQLFNLSYDTIKFVEDNINDNFFAVPENHKIFIERKPGEMEHLRIKTMEKEREVIIQ
jgi:hypothetical protein